MKPKRKVFGVVVKSADRERGIITFMGTTPRKDRYGDIVVPEGGNLTDYMNNPVFLWCHDYSKPPIGKCLAYRVYPGTGIEYDIQFDMADSFAADIFRKYADGYMSAVSIGFQPEEWEKLESKDSYWGSYKYTKWSQLELSAVPVPANPDALQNALMKAMSGTSDPEEVAKLIGLAYGATPRSEGDHAEPQERKFDIVCNQATRTVRIVDEDGNDLGEAMCSDEFRSFIFDHEDRAGAVLSKKNKDKLGHCKALIDEVLTSAEKAPDEEGCDDDDDTPAKGIADLIDGAVAKSLAPILEKLAAGVSPAASSMAATRSPNLSAAQPNTDLIARAVELAVERQMDAVLSRLTGKLPDQ